MRSGFSGARAIFAAESLADSVVADLVDRLAVPWLRLNSCPIQGQAPSALATPCWAFSGCALICRGAGKSAMIRRRRQSFLTTDRGIIMLAARMHGSSLLIVADRTNRG